MIGKSYDGTFANGVASTGVDGLTTIVPISAISDWYDYSRMGGIRFNTHYPASLSNTITQNQQRLDARASSRRTATAVRGDAQRAERGRRRLRPATSTRSGRTATTT